METESSSIYRVKIGNFEGPFGLLLHLIEERKLFINDLSLAEVTEDFLKHMNALGQIRPEEVSSFVVVAATLILIKSKSLLPNLSLTREEEKDIKSLEDRLRLYELFTKLSVNIKQRFGKKMIFPLSERKNEFLVFLPDEEITRESMMTFAKSVLGAMPKMEKLPEVEVKKVITIEEMINRLTERIKESLKINFREFAGNSKSSNTKEAKVEVIVSFLAMLELVRQGIMEAFQEEGGDIVMSRKL